MSDWFNITQEPDSVNLFIYPDGDYDTSLSSYGDTNNYECIDTNWNTITEDTYVYLDSVSTASDWYTLPTTTTNLGTINYVKLIARATTHLVRPNSSDTFRLLFYDGTSEVSYDSNVLTNDYNKIYENIYTKPSTNNEWEWSDITGLRIGIKLNNTNRISNYYYDYLSPNSTTYLYSDYFTTDGDDTCHECVDDPVSNPDDNTTKVIKHNAWGDTGIQHAFDVSYPSLTSSAIDYYDIDIDEVRVYFRCYSDTVNSYVKFRADVTTSDGTDSGTTRTPSADTWTTYNETYSNPAGGSWSLNDFNDIDVDMYMGRHGTGVPRVTQEYIRVKYRINDVIEKRITHVYAMVNYTPTPSTVSLSIPDQLSVSHSRDINRFTFPDGDYEIADMGRSGKSLNLSGIEYNSTVSDMQKVKDMCHYGSTVSLTNLPDSNLNTDYLIRSFSWNDISFNDETQDRIYRWTLQLEEA